MAKNRKVATAKSELVDALPLACADEAAAVAFFERVRWGATPNCPRCGDVDVAQMKGRDGSRNKRFLWTCHGCKRQFTVRVGAVMEDSPVPLKHWAYAWWAACASKKGVSAKQIERMTGVSYRTALFMMHRIRYAMAPANANDAGMAKLSGTVEVDETYVGGKPRTLAGHGRFSRTKRAMGPRPGFPDRKVPVVAAVERTRDGKPGRVRARVANVNGLNLKATIRETCDPSSRIMTDERRGYQGIGREFAGGHHTVNHTDGEYARGDVHTNTIEGFFPLLKRGIIGTYHAVSKEHLHRYVAEFEYRYNTRALDGGERTALAIQNADHKRLTYSQQVGR